jgi:predicted component of type VI protein secretion system
MVPLVVQIEKTEQHTADTVAFKRSPVRLGRNPLNDLPLEEGFVSQWHAVVRFNAERTTVLDLGSTNRTTVNGQPIERNTEVPVDHTSDVRIGSLRLHFLRVEAPPELFNQRRRSAFARVGNPEQGDVNRTMFLGDRIPPPAVLEALASTPPPAAMQPTPPAGAAGARAPIAVSSSIPVAPSQPPGPQGWGPKPVATSYPRSAPPGKESLSDAYRAYREGWSAFLASLRAHFQGLPAGQRESELVRIQGLYPQLGLEPEFREYLRELGIDPLKSGSPEMEDWLRRLTNGLFPPPGASINIALAMERVGELLEVFSQAFVEMRRAHEQFCREMSLAYYSEPTPLQMHEDPHVVLAYLLAPTHEGKDRATELQRGLADFALHQVALTGSVVEGARSLLETLSPKAVKRAPDPPSQSSMPSDESFMERIWPQGTRTLWRRFSALHCDLAESDRFTRELFGRSFARRYYSITGGNGND